jgi:hypothetical protein
LPLGAIEKIDRLAKEQGESRSDFVRRVLLTVITEPDQRYQTALTETLAPLKPIIEKFVQELSQNPDLVRRILDKGLQKMANMFTEVMFKEKATLQTNSSRGQREL